MCWIDSEPLKEEYKSLLHL